MTLEPEDQAEIERLARRDRVCALVCGAPREAVAAVEDELLSALDRVGHRFAFVGTTTPLPMHAQRFSPMEYADDPARHFASAVYSNVDLRMALRDAARIPRSVVVAAAIPDTVEGLLRVREERAAGPAAVPDVIVGTRGMPALCGQCALPLAVDDEIATIAAFGISEEDYRQVTRRLRRRGPGCPSCGGGVVLAEFLRLEGEPRAAFDAGVAAPVVRELARKTGFAPIRDRALAAALAGRIAIDEVEALD